MKLYKANVVQLWPLAFGLASLNFLWPVILGLTVNAIVPSIKRFLVPSQANGLGLFPFGCVSAIYQNGFHKYHGGTWWNLHVPL